MKGTILIDHIVIPDAHCKPEISNRRFVWLGKFIRDYVSEANKEGRLVRIIEMGDFEDMPSLSHWDRGKLQFEGRRYQDDINHVRDARQKTVEQLFDLDWVASKNKKKMPQYSLTALGGNHFERRQQKIYEDNPHLLGILEDPKELANEFGFEYVPFLQPVTYEGITYVHYWQARGSSQPIGTGKYPASVLIREKHTSTIVGHSHVLDIGIGTDARQNRIFAGASGCYLDPDQKEDYAGQSNEEWWRGILVLRGVAGGYPEAGWTVLPIEALQRQYE